MSRLLRVELHTEKWLVVTYRSSNDFCAGGNYESKYLVHEHGMFKNRLKKNWRYSSENDIFFSLWYKCRGAAVSRYGNIEATYMIVCEKNGIFSGRHRKIDFFLN